MSSNKKKCAVVALALSICIPYGITASKSQGVGPSVPVAITHGPPTPDVYGKHWSGRVFSLPNELDDQQHLDVKVNYDTLGKKISLSFYYLEDPDVITSGFAIAYEDYPTDFFPTSVSYLAGNKIAIAGKSDKSGLAEVQVWSLSNPEIIKKYVDAGLPPELYIKPSSINKKEDGFLPSDGSNFGLIRAIWRNRGLGGNNIFALSAGSRDLYAINLDNGVAQIVIGSSMIVGALPAEPDLILNWPSYKGPRRHAVHGDVYMLTTQGDLFAHAGTEEHSLYIFDTNMDGTPDITMPMSADLEHSMGLKDASSWIWD